MGCISGRLYMLLEIPDGATECIRRLSECTQSRGNVGTSTASYCCLTQLLITDPVQGSGQPRPWTAHLCPMVLHLFDLDGTCSVNHGKKYDTSDHQASRGPAYLTTKVRMWMPSTCTRSSIECEDSSTGNSTVGIWPILRFWQPVSLSVAPPPPPMSAGPSTFTYLLGVLCRTRRGCYVHDTHQCVVVTLMVFQPHQTGRFDPSDAGVLSVGWVLGLALRWSQIRFLG